MSTENEFALENKLIDQLKSMRYEFIKFEDKLDMNNSGSLIDSSFAKNLKKQIETLNDIILTAVEFQEIMHYLNRGDEVDKAARIRGKYPLKRNGKLLKHLKFLLINDWCKNIFQVTNQLKVEGERRNRYDVTILINGFPMVQIELKRRGENLNTAFNQCTRYKQDSMLGSIFEYIQLFIISDGIETKYMANSQCLDKGFCFHYTDFKNNIVGNLDEFTMLFLEQCNVAKVICKYMIVCDNIADERLNMVMRPYQMHAVEAILNKVKNTVENGYIWHTTGSGKTLTSYKACEIISEINGIDKVFFIVDRNDLDSQTVDEYQKFSAPGKNKITETTDTNILKKKIYDKNEKIIVTTIQKLQRAVRALNFENKTNYKNRVVLIFDECHRSQLGDMHKDIDTFFEVNQKFGFTGTPILQENSQKYMTTSDVFGQQLHTYLINNAISDKNVLGFEVEYKKPMKEKTKIEDAHIESYDLKEIYGSLNYKKKVVEDILATYNIYTKHSFNAMLVCDSIESVIQYYEILKKSNTKLKIACVFSVNDNEEIKENITRSVDAMTMMIEDYNQLFKNDRGKPNYSYQTFFAYKKDVEKRIKNKSLDLVIVRDMFLTGFDAKVINTMYFDRFMKYHSLIQAMSRTNRINGPKKDYGKIIFYRQMKEYVDEAIRLFSDENAPQNILKKPYEDYVMQINQLLEKFKLTYESTDMVLNIQSETQKFEFINAYRDIIRLKSALESFQEFKYDDISFNEQDFVDYTSVYRSLVPKKTLAETDSILDGFDFEMELVCEDIINVDYIFQLLGNIQKSKDQDELEIQKLKALNELNNKHISESKLEIIKKVIERYNMQGNITDLYYHFVDEDTQSELLRITEEFNLNHDKLVQLYSGYEYDGKLDNSMIRKVFNQPPKLLESRELVANIRRQLFELKMK